MLRKHCRYRRMGWPDLIFAGRDVRQSTQAFLESPRIDLREQTPPRGCGLRLTFRARTVRSHPHPIVPAIHLVMDNLNIHRQKSLTEVFGAEMAAEVWDRFTVHHTPTHGSWLNQAEIEIGIFSRQCLALDQGSEGFPTSRLYAGRRRPGIAG